MKAWIFDTTHKLSNVFTLNCFAKHTYLEPFNPFDIWRSSNDFTTGSGQSVVASILIHIDNYGESQTLRTKWTKPHVTVGSSPHGYLFKSAKSLWFWKNPKNCNKVLLQINLQLEHRIACTSVFFVFIFSVENVRSDQIWQDCGQYCHIKYCYIFLSVQSWVWNHSNNISTFILWFFMLANVLNIVKLHLSRPSH